MVNNTKMKVGIILSKKSKMKNSIELDTLYSNLEKTQSDLHLAYSNFENVVDPDLIDAYIYEVNAAQKHYHFFLKQLRALKDIVSE
jgi:Protein of unknown function (DUF2508).